MAGKKLLSSCLLLGFISFSTPILPAGFVGPGSGSTVTTAAGALQAGDDAPCVLEGKLECKIASRKNRYLFSDGSGKIIVEIKKKIFGNYTVTPHNRVRLEGEVEWSSKYPNEVEVESLTVLD